MTKGTNRVKQWWMSFEQHPVACWVFSGVWLLLISWIAFLWNLGNTGLIDETEPLFAEAARQMVVTGDWITPTFNGDTRFDKPPLVYWLMAIAYRLIGVNEWAVRLPSAGAAIALISLGFWTLQAFGATASSPKRAQRQRWLTAWIGSTLMAVNFHTLIWARTGVSDMLLSGCMGAALLCFFWGYAQTQNQTNSFLPANHWYWAFYVFLALAVLAKGPVGVVLPGLIIGPFLLYVGRLKAVLKEMGFVVGGLVFGAIAVPWFVLVSLKHGSAYTSTFFGYHNFERFTDVVNGHSAPWYYYFAIVLGLFAPWSVYLPVAISRLRLRRSWWLKQPRSAQLGLFALFWFAGIFVFFSISVTKLPSYVLPLIPAAAILVSLLWSEESTATNNKKQSWGLIASGICNVLLLLILAAACLYSPSLLGTDPAVEQESELLQASGIPLLGGIIWSATALASVWLLSSHLRRWLVLPNLIGVLAFIVFVLMPVSFMVDRERQLPLREMAAVVEQAQQPGEEIWMAGFRKPSLVFYTQGRSVKFFKTNGRLREHLANNAYPNSVLLLSHPDKTEEYELEPQDYQTLATQGAYQLIRVAPQQLADDS
ncbi:MAG: ArnT family glycosyltransferase [Cyanophyceae cyanobacterium]